MAHSEYWIDDHLPDGTLLGSLGAGLSYHDGIIHGWIGRDCLKCNGTGEDFSDENSPYTTCRQCAGTCEDHGPVWRVEE